MQIQAAAGAEDAVKYCGGLVAIVTAAGLSLGGAKVGSGIPLPECSDPFSVTSVQMDFCSYEDVKARLGNQKRLGMQLIDPEGSIPEATLAAVRCVITTKAL